MDGEQDSQGVNETALLRAERAFQDGFIAERLPQWMKSATPQQLRLLGEAMGKSIALRSDLKRVLARIEALDDFIKSKLQAALRTRYSAQFNLHQWSFIGGHPEPVINTQPVGVHLTKLQYDKRSLLEAAVRNFTVEQTKADGQPRGNRLTSARQGGIKAPSATEFATLCRELDLGSAYQQHLDQVLSGLVTDDKPTWTVQSLLADWSRHAMLLDAYKARYSAGLNEQELALIAKLCANDQPQDKASPVKPQRLNCGGSIPPTPTLRSAPGKWQCSAPAGIWRQRFVSFAMSCRHWSSRSIPGSPLPPRCWQGRIAGGSWGNCWHAGNASPTTARH
ncbi:MULTISPECIES: dermonecrotic toxin domain-containing protein [Pseudomonas]|uniref:Dermonecrotic toxin N-terminal domain-containing protein n=1 Tax=Pseudomonas putida TaxID=303 RepID=A0A1B2F3J6_PSEPU|nr:MULTISPECIES: DUF6543 domain-containing protein [Pseudomonas]ANY86785.1 hypothetical protein IEC33019_1217 [Pseudomonas putida]MCL8307924.1 hypothetical protein [Pseudomonas putida]